MCAPCCRDQQHKRHLCLCQGGYSSCDGTTFSSDTKGARAVFLSVKAFSGQALSASSCDNNHSACREVSVCMKRTFSSVRKKIDGQALSGTPCENKSSACREVSLSMKRTFSNVRLRALFRSPPTPPHSVIQRIIPYLVLLGCLRQTRAPTTLCLMGDGRCRAIPPLSSSPWWERLS